MNPDPQPAAAEAPPNSAAQRPQPVDYGLTYDDLSLYNTSGWARTLRLDDGNVIQCLGTRPDDKYKKRKRCFLHRWHAREGMLVGLAFWVLLLGGFMMFGKESRLVGLILIGFGLACVSFAVLPGVLLKRLRARASPGPGLIAYWQALHRYDKEIRRERMTERVRWPLSDAGRPPGIIILRTFGTLPRLRWN